MINGKEYSSVLIRTYGNTQLVEISILQIVHELLAHQVLRSNNFQSIVIFLTCPLIHIGVIRFKFVREDNLSVSLPCGEDKQFITYIQIKGKIFLTSILQSHSHQIYTHREAAGFHWNPATSFVLCLCRSRIAPSSQLQTISKIHRKYA